MAVELRPFRSPLEPAFESWGDVEEYLDNPGLATGRKDHRLQRRARWLSLLLTLMLGALFARLWQLQIAGAEVARQQARRNRVRSIPIPPPRGLLCDRAGVPLATSVAHYAAAVVPAELQDQATTFRALGRLLGVPPGTLASVVAARRDARDFVPIIVKQQLTPEQIAALEENRVRLPGVVVIPELVRRYPRGTLAAHALGHTGEVAPAELEARRSDRRLAPGDTTGKLGLERRYDTLLLGEKGSLLVEIDARGHPLGRSGEQEERVGHSVVLTLDTRLQGVAEAALRNSGHPGAAVLLSVTNGAVLALASQPTFDPNLFATPLTPQAWRALSKNPDHPLLNRVTGGRYPPGSTFKIVTAAAALDLGLITPSSVIVCDGALKVGQREFRCTGRHGGLMLAPALARSCNVYFMTLGRRVGATRLAAYARRLGLGEPTGIDLPRESLGLVPEPSWKLKRRAESWMPGDTLNLSIGQGYLLATPLQIARMVSAVAGGGRMPTPHLMQEVRDLQGAVSERASSPVVSTGLPEAVLMHLRRGMRQAVVGGTASLLNTSVVTVAAKTGSSQNVEGARTHAWVAAFAPFEQPRFVCVVLLENAGHGGEAAAPVARRLLEAAFTPRQLEAADGVTGVH